MWGVVVFQKCESSIFLSIFLRRAPSLFQDICFYFSLSSVTLLSSLSIPESPEVFLFFLLKSERFKLHFCTGRLCAPVTFCYLLGCQQVYSNEQTCRLRCGLPLSTKFIQCFSSKFEQRTFHPSAFKAKRQNKTNSMAWIFCRDSGEEERRGRRGVYTHKYQLRYNSITASTEQRKKRRNFAWGFLSFDYPSPSTTTIIGLIIKAG